MSSAINEKRLTWKRSLDGFEDVGLCDGVTVGEAICKLADLEEAETVKEVHGRWTDDGICTVCGGAALYYPMTTRVCKSANCPHCGAKLGDR